MKFIEQHPRESRSAADTGSAMHKAASEWHKHGKEVKKALAAMRAAREEYPMADLLEAERLFQAYSEDPRNQEAEIVACEYHLTGEIEGVALEGTLDQIREEREAWSVWDLKTSARQGSQIRDGHTYQICAYSVLATKTFKRPVSPGGVILPRAYPNKEAFYPYEISVKRARDLMLHVVHRVQEVRLGRVAPIPGDHCAWCIGVPACLTKLEALNV